MPRITYNYIYIMANKIKEGIYALAMSMSLITCGAAVLMSLFFTPILALCMVASALLFISWYARTSNKYDAFGIGTYLLFFITVTIWFQPQNSTLIETQSHFHALIVLGAYTVFHFIRMVIWTLNKCYHARRKTKKLLISNLLFTAILACTWLAGLAKAELACSTLVTNALLMAYIPVLTCTFVDLE